MESSYPKWPATAQPPRALRFSELSHPRQMLVRLCQSVNFGQICGLEVRDFNPVFDPPPSVLLEVKLDSVEGRRREINLTDFILPAEFRRLVEHLDEYLTATIERLDVRAGIPRRAIFRTDMQSGLGNTSRARTGRDPLGDIERSNGEDPNL